MGSRKKKTKKDLKPYIMRILGQDCIVFGKRFSKTKDGFNTIKGYLFRGDYGKIVGSYKWIHENPYTIPEKL